MLDSGLHSVVLAIGFSRVNRVVVVCPRLEPVHAHAENGIGMARVQPNWRFRRLVQFHGIRTVAHNAVMLGRAAKVVAGPPIIAKSGSARSISGPCVIRTRAALFVVGLTCVPAGVE
jgi:hypothetical protein